jgi:hypothetical protein
MDLLRSSPIPRTADCPPYSTFDDRRDVNNWNNCLLDVASTRDIMYSNYRKTSPPPSPPQLLTPHQNNPLYLKTFPKPSSTPIHPPTNPSTPLPSPSPSLKYHFLAHSALDIIEERIVSGAKTIDTYFGLLHILEDVNIYGFLTNTLVKIIVMIEGGDGSGGIRDSDIKLVPPPSPLYFGDTNCDRL